MLKTSVSCFEDQHLRGWGGGWKRRRRRRGGRRNRREDPTHLTGPVPQKPYLQNNGVGALAAIRRRHSGKLKQRLKKRK